MNIRSFVKELNGQGAESELVKTAFVSLTTSFGLLLILYFLGLKNEADFIPKYGFYLFLAILGYAAILPSIILVRAYKEFACMSGMMIGMTIGMISGFLPGFYLGATNGMFWGSVLGMSLGIYLGVSNGKCCGIMGAMEGMMAGFMGGLMGAMTAIMMINDHLRAAAVIVFLIAATILFGLNYMIYKEAKEAGMERKHKDNLFYTVVWSSLLTIATTWFMLYGPRSGLFQ